MRSVLTSCRRTVMTTCLLLLLLLTSGAGFLFNSTSVYARPAASQATLSLGTGRAIDVSVFVEPQSGETPILNAINNATTSVYVEMYLLTDTNVISALENAAGRGLDVRVMLDPSPYGVGTSQPAQTIQALNAAGAQAEDSNPSFTYTHEKGMIIDGKTAYIMTSNFTKAALGGDSSSTTNREYDIVDTESTDVAVALGIFNADWARSSYTLSDNDIVLSPVNSLSDFTALINKATTSLSIEAEEMSNSSVEQAIVSAEARGVNVQVILPNDDDNSSGITTLKDGGVSVYKDTQYYMHAKLIIADGTEAFVGSENISTTSLTKNRELGTLLAKASLLTTLKNTFSSDLANSKAA